MAFLKLSIAECARIHTKPKHYSLTALTSKLKAGLCEPISSEMTVLTMPCCVMNSFI